MEKEQNVDNLYVYHALTGDQDQNGEFSVELYDFESSTKDSLGSPVKKITNFDELIDFLDEIDEE